PYRIDSLSPHAHTIAQAKNSLRFAASRSAAVRLGDNHVVALAKRAPHPRDFLQPVYTHEPLDEKFDQFHEESELLHGNNQRLVFLTEMALHELRRLPFHQF